MKTRNSYVQFWYVGKSAASLSTCSPDVGAAVQRRLIFEHAKLLQTELRRASALQVTHVIGIYWHLLTALIFISHA